MCYGLLCESGMDHSLVQEWAGKLPLKSRQRLVLGTIGTAPVKNYLVGLALGLNRDNPRVKYWQQYLYSAGRREGPILPNNSMADIGCKQCWVAKYSKPYFQCRTDIEACLGICQQCVITAGRLTKAPVHTTDLGRGHMIIMVFYAEAVITAISILIQQYRIKKKMPVWSPERTRQDAEREYLQGGDPDAWGFSYGDALAFGCIRGTFVLASGQISRQNRDKPAIIHHTSNVNPISAPTADNEPRQGRKRRRKQENPIKLIPMPTVEELSRVKRRLKF